MEPILSSTALSDIVVTPWQILQPFHPLSHPSFLFSSKGSTHSFLHYFYFFYFFLTGNLQGQKNKANKEVLKIAVPPVATSDWLQKWSHTVTT